MEAVAIALLAMILVLGGLTFFVFFQFLSLTRENRRLYQKILEEVQSLKKAVDKNGSALSSGTGEKQEP